MGFPSGIATAACVAGAIIILVSMGTEFTGMVAHQSYAGFAQPLQSYAIQPEGMTFSPAGSQKTMSLSASDFAVYRYGYVSYDGGQWQRFELSGSTLGGDWLNGSVSAKIPMAASDFGLSQSRFSTQRNFVVVYSCSRTAGSWDCHDGWQIWQFDASLQSSYPSFAEVVGVSASTYEAPHVPENTLDGNFSAESRWSADGDGAWIEYELNETALVDSVSVAAWDGSSYFIFDVSVSTDGSEWTQVYSGHSDGIANGLERFSFDAVPARFVRITGHGNNGTTYPTWNSYLEVRVGDFPIGIGADCGNCDDGDSCTADACVDSACSHVQITSCAGGDSCCPPGCTQQADSDCPPVQAGTAESGYLAGVPLIHDQTFLIPENAVSGDTVGDLNLMWVATGQAVSFSMQDDDGGSFSVDQNGRISVAAASLDYDSQPQRQLTVRAAETATGKYSDAVITVLLSRNEDTVFVDPTWSGCHDGTRACPYGSWSGVSFQPSRTYLQKRDTTVTYSTGGYAVISISADGTAEKHLVVGAYGAGNRPEVDCHATGGRTMFLGSGYDHDGSDAPHYVDLYSFMVHGCYSIRTSYFPSDIIFRDLVIYNTSDNGGIYVFGEADVGTYHPDDYRVLIEDVVSHDNADHGIKCQAGGITARNLLLYNNGGHGISFPAWSGYNKVEHVRAYGNDESGVEIGSIDTNLSHALVWGNYYGVWIDDVASGYASGVVARDNYADGIFIDMDSSKVTVENCTSNGNADYGFGVRWNATDVTIRNNEIYGNGAGGVVTRRYNDAGTYVWPGNALILGNSIHDNGGAGVEIRDGDDIVIEGNTFRGNGQAITVSSSAVNVTQPGNVFL